MHKVLVVDDEEPILELLKYNLEKSGYEVKTALDGAKAVDIARKFIPDLVLLDIMMPKMDGFELYTKIREKDSKVKICFLTAIAAFNEEFRKIRLVLGKTINEDYFIQKPVEMEDLLKKLTSIMNI